MEEELSGLKNLVDYYWTKDLFQFFAKEESHRGILDACIKINIFDSAHSYISNNITTFSSFL